LNLIKEFSLTQRGLFKNFSHVEMVFLFQNEVAQVPAKVLNLTILNFRNFVQKLEHEIMGA
jgi:hypothetical protein